MAAERVRLRPLRREDRGLLYEWITDRDLLILNTPYRPVGEGEHDEWFESMLRKRSDLVIFAIEELASSRAVGTCQLLNINWIHRSAELQIRIGNAEYRGRGYGSEAIQLLTEFGFRDLNLHRIYLHVFGTNQPAIKAYAKCGFEQEGILKEAAFINGQWIDVVVMALIGGING